MITNLQVLRALAALAVVFYHTRFQINGVGTDFMGVCVFFVISGFIMTHVSRQSVDLFMTKRLARIVPLYWVCTLVYLMWGNLGLANPLYTFPLFAKWAVSDPMNLVGWVKANYGLSDPVARERLIQSLLFVPYQNHAGEMHPVLGVGWTLNLELFFYVLFSIALWLSQRWAPLLVGVALVTVKAVSYALDAPGGVLEFYAHPYTFCFVLGIAAFYGWRAVEQSARTWGVVAVGATASVFAAYYLALCLQVVEIGEPASKTQEIVSMLSAAAAVVFALLLHSAGARCSARLMILLGNASYALYLTHSIAVDTLRTLGQRWHWLDSQQTMSGMLIAMALSLVLALLVYRYVEMPLLSILKRWINPRPRGDAANAVV